MKSSQWYCGAALAVLVLAGCAKPEKSGPAALATTVHVEVTEAGFVPATATVPKGQPITLTMTRRTNQTCATDVVFPALNIKRDLPLDQEVTIELPAQPAGTLSYACGMDMVKGNLVVQ
jgi:plastocyanin domain-containing protein